MEVMFVCAYQCYTPPGAPPVGHKLLGLVNLILRLSPTRILFLSFYFLSPLRGRAVALFSVEDKDIFFVFFWVLHPCPLRVMSAVAQTKICFLCFIGSLLGLCWVCIVMRTKINFLVFLGTCGFGLLMCSELTSAIVWRLSWFIKNLNGAQRAIRKRGLLWLNYQE